MLVKKCVTLSLAVLLAIALCTLACIGALAAPKLAYAASPSPTVTVTRVATGKLVMKKGAQYKLNATTNVGALSYKSTNSKVVSVSKKGVLKAHRIGKATIKVIAKNGKAKDVRSIKVTVIKASKFKRVTKIVVSVGSRSIVVGSTTKTKIAFTPKKASNCNVIFTSSAPKIAAVSADGTITAKSVGTAKVTVKSCDNSKAKASVTITVVPSDQSQESTEEHVKAKAMLSDYSWVELKAIANEVSSCDTAGEGLALAQKYNLANSDGKLVGDLKELTLADGTVCHVRILGFRHDEKNDGGKAGITFEFADIPTNNTVNSLRTNDKGWLGCGVRSWLNESFFALLPNDVQASIAPVDKKTNNVGQTYVPNTEHHNSNWTGCVTKTFNDKLWLLSVSEVYGKLANQDSSIWSPKTYDAEGTQYQLYADEGASVANCSFCVKYDAVEGVAQNWWLRSLDAMDSVNWYGVDVDGNPISDVASVAYGISPCFCF